MATPRSPMGWPSCLTSAGLGSQVSTCEGAPAAKMWMTRLALAGKGGILGASGERPTLVSAAKRESSRSKEVRPKAPKPMPRRDRNSRREDMGVRTQFLQYSYSYISDLV